mmetsp:Transcript_8123/g.21667  ORF Transcript_8123/g.21667 Transcript_8123/m.21667 type:complete len:104 (-) Transcript_8123:522-833(-)
MQFIHGLPAVHWHSMHALKKNLGMANSSSHYAYSSEAYKFLHYRKSMKDGSNLACPEQVPLSGVAFLRQAHENCFCNKQQSQTGSMVEKGTRHDGNNESWVCP